MFSIKTIYLTFHINYNILLYISYHIKIDEKDDKKQYNIHVTPHNLNWKT